MGDPMWCWRRRGIDRYVNARGNAFVGGMLPWIVVVVLSLALSGCIAEAPGTVVFGLNESDHDVIIASSHHASTPLILPAHTWGKLFDDYEEPNGEITVYDLTCGVLATFPLTRQLDTLRIGKQDEIELVGGRVSQLPSGVQRAPDNPNGDGTLWVERDCRDE